MNWLVLLDYTAKKWNGINYRLVPGISLGYNYIVRIIEFIDRTRWVVRL